LGFFFSTDMKKVATRRGDPGGASALVEIVSGTRFCWGKIETSLGLRVIYHPSSVGLEE
jgi:hypothetical protein